MQPLHWDAINPFTGTPFTWDDPNLRWGDPSVYLEPGDAGFTPYLSASQPPPKLKRMKRQAYYPARYADQIVWIENFCHKIAAHAAALGLGAAQVAAIVADCRWLIYVLGSWLPGVRAWALACTDASKQAQSGPGTALMALPVFTAPPLPAAVGGMPAVVPVNDGALDRIFDWVASIKEINACTEAIRTDLRIIGPEETAPDLATVQPVLTATRSGTTVNLGWNFGGNGKFLDLLEAEVDRSDGKGYVHLVSDTTPNYTDTTPHPATPTLWKYRAIYRVNDARVGLWSAEVSVMVGG